MAGEFQDSNNVFHAFVGARNGSFKEFDVPGAGTGAFQGSVALDINNQGATAGVYIDAANAYHGFVRTRDGTITPFDPSGSVFTFVCEETCLSDQGSITGSYLDASNVSHGFVRDKNGQITAPIDAPGASGTGLGDGTNLASINAKGSNTGYFMNSSGVFYGLLRSRGGTLTPFQVPGATGFTVGFSINPSGAIAGLWGDASGINQGYERFSNGTFEKFNAPGATGTGFMQGTRTSTNNASGVVVGWWADATALVHGFVWTPGRSH
jgi:hypothetical protein